MNEKIIMTTITPKLNFQEKILEIETAQIFDDVVISCYKEILDLKEKLVCDGLIALGWTPPPGVTHE